MTEQPGSVAEEASRLFAAAEAWWHAARPGSEAADAAGAAHDGAPHDGAAARGWAAHAGPECRICPLCQLLALLRTTRPEVFEHLSSAALSVVQAARAVVDAHERTGGRRSGPGHPVEHITIR